MSNITDFVNLELYPALFGRVREAFPEMDFQPYMGGWASPFKLNGERSHDKRREKSRITKAVPNRILENGGESIDLISFYMERNNLTQPIDAIKALASICGLTLPPMGDSESFRLWKEKQDRLERVASQMAEALLTDERAKDTLSYLTEVRGYDMGFIKFGGFGFVSPSHLRELQDIFKDGSTFPYGVGDSHTLAIPYRTGGRINGFIFRTINPETTKGKYLYVFLSKKASQNFNLFGLTGLKLTGNGERDRDITIVEGQLDALRASYSGVNNVVSAGGSKVYKEALQEAKKRGVKRVIILFDADEAGRKGTEEAIGIIQAEGLTPLVATLPSSDGEKMDVDRYLRTYSVEGLQDIIDNYLPASVWLFYRKGEQEKYKNGLASQKLIDEYKRETISICNLPSTSPTDRDQILREFSEATGITKEALQEEADALKLAEEKSRQRQETISLTAEALKLANNGKVEEALTLLQANIQDLSQISREAEYSSLLLTPTAEGIRQRFKDKPVGVKTNFAFKTQSGEEERLILPVGLTYVCAGTSHGKSRFLENLAIQLATDGEAGDILYFSFEEDVTAVELQLLNIYANMRLSRNTSRSLNSYYTKGSNYFDRGADLTSFKQKEAGFLSLLTSGKLRVYYKDYDSTELIGAIRYLSKQTKVKAVFVDYIQLLHTRGTRLQRREELGEMCKNLWRLAEEAALPIVLAAQLNREANSPLDMASQNIAEAADIERSAHTIILLWNSAFTPPTKSSYYTGDKFSEGAKRIEGLGLHIGTGGRIYAKISKNRGSVPNVEAVLDFNGDTGRIEANYTEEAPAQGYLFNDPQNGNYSPY